MRSLLGFGIRDVAFVRPCVDVFDPHVLRASMGSFFKLRVRTYDSFDDYRADFPDRPLYPFMLDGAQPLDAVASRARPPFSLVFGNEQTGLPPVFAELGQSVLIPQSDEIDSLNLAVAVSVGAYVFTRPKP
jgi:TrmH family RNA methyltransferase